MSSASLMTVDRGVKTARSPYDNCEPYTSQPKRRRMGLTIRVPPVKDDTVTTDTENESPEYKRVTPRPYTPEDPRPATSIALNGPMVEYKALDSFEPLVERLLVPCDNQHVINNGGSVEQATYTPVDPQISEHHALLVKTLRQALGDNLETLLIRRSYAVSTNSKPRTRHTSHKTWIPAMELVDEAMAGFGKSGPFITVGEDDKSMFFYWLSDVAYNETVRFGENAGSLLNEDTYQCIYEQLLLMILKSVKVERLARKHRDTMEELYKSFLKSQKLLSV